VSAHAEVSIQENVDVLVGHVHGLTCMIRHPSRVIVGDGSHNFQLWIGGKFGSNSIGGGNVENGCLVEYT